MQITWCWTRCYPLSYFASVYICLRLSGEFLLWIYCVSTFLFQEIYLDLNFLSCFLDLSYLQFCINSTTGHTKISFWIIHIQGMAGGRVLSSSQYQWRLLEAGTRPLCCRWRSWPWPRPDRLERSRVTPQDIFTRSLLSSWPRVMQLCSWTDSQPSPVDGLY